MGFLGLGFIGFIIKIQMYNHSIHSHVAFFCLTVVYSVNNSNYMKRRAQGAELDELLPEAFALVREASERVLGLRHFDVQLLLGDKMRTQKGLMALYTLVGSIVA